MIGDAIVKMVSALKNKKFKLDSGFSPFSYFTTIAFHAFINRIKKEKKHHETITNYRDRVYTDMMTNNDKDAGYHIYVDPNSTEETDNYNATGS
jgi:DNA-directed RNA polymerase specialized sigma24 family protein